MTTRPLGPRTAAAVDRDQHTPSPLAAAALLLIDEGVTTAHLVERFARVGAVVDEAVARSVLAELASLGMIRVARGTDSERIFVLTTLGQRRVAATGWLRPDDADAMRELERLRTDLLATIAHELRTPLTAIRTSVGLLHHADARPTEEQHAQLVDTIERNAERMQRLVDDTLDLTRFREGRIQLQKRRFDAVDLARSVVASFPPPAATRIHAPAGPVWVFGDRRRLEHALVNLVSNARKYSPPDLPIDVIVERSGADVRWTVVDRGAGISESDQRRLFERFFVGRSDRSAEREGVGLGLPITLAIVQAHGGAIEVERELGHGSRFSIVVPAAGPETAEE